MTEAGIFVGAFDGFENNIKIYASSDGTNFGLHRTITAPEGGIAGAIRRGKRMALAGSRDMYCVLYGETFTGLTQMRMNCEKNPKIQAQSASVQNTGGTQPQAEADPEEDDWLTGLNEPHDKDLQPETALILGSLLDEAGEEAIPFGLAATFVRGDLDSMQPQVWLQGFLPIRALQAFPIIDGVLRDLDQTTFQAGRCPPDRGSSAVNSRDGAFSRDSGRGGKRRSQASRIVVGPKPTDVTIHKDLFRDLVGGLRVLVQSVEPKPQNRRQNPRCCRYGE